MRWIASIPEPHWLDLLLAVRRLGGRIGAAAIAFAHNTLAMLGLAALLVGVALAARPDWRAELERQALELLQARAVTPELAELAAGHAPGLLVEVGLHELPKEQARVADWLARKYRIAPDPMAHMVAAAFDTAATLKLDPLLVLAVAAVESGFNPFVQSGMGAQGLMQVMSRVHQDKFERFGGTAAAFDPVTSIKVGAAILRDYVSRAGSIEGGLRMYVGSTTPETEGGYGSKVLAERARLAEVAAGKRVPTSVPLLPAAIAPAGAADAPQPTGGTEVSMTGAPRVGADAPGKPQPASAAPAARADPVPPRLVAGL